MTRVYQDALPDRVRVIVLGGGIHGAGILHDMASRGWRDIHLLEKSTIGAGTSGRSTKLIHGGLRYLRQIRDFGLVAEALRERKLLLDLLPDLVKPIEMLLPVMKDGGLPRWMIKSGLFLYDRLAGRARIHPHQNVSLARVQDLAPPLDLESIRGVYAFWDAQTDDLALVRRVIGSAKRLGASVTEGVEVVALQPTADGYDVTVRQVDGTLRTISALYVVNALGPWANRLLERSHISPTHRGMNNKGTHILADDLGLKAGLFLQSPDDGRIFFLLPWMGHTLIGTTEDVYPGDPDALNVTESEVDYLVERCNRFLVNPLVPDSIKATFSGLRWLAVEAGESLTETSRAYVIGERASQRGLLLTLYGGKLTTYRNLSQTIGDRITTHFGEFRPTRTAEARAWAKSTDVALPGPSVVERFHPSYVQSASSS